MPTRPRPISAQRARPIVVKADGLAAGKGVTVAETLERGLAAVDAACWTGAFGAAGAELVIEECLVGEEASFFALVDGESALPLAPAQDHKQVGEGDTGPNTGGMGAYSPAPALTRCAGRPDHGGDRPADRGRPWRRRPALSRACSTPG